MSPPEFWASSTLGIGDILASTKLSKLVGPCGSKTTAGREGGLCEMSRKHQSTHALVGLLHERSERQAVQHHAIHFELTVIRQIRMVSRSGTGEAIATLGICFSRVIFRLFRIWGGINRGRFRNQNTPSIITGICKTGPKRIKYAICLSLPHCNSHYLIMELVVDDFQIWTHSM